MALRNLSIASLLALVAGPAFAHHSAQAFDRTHPLLLQGTVKEFVWSNPHSWVTLLVPTAEGAVTVDTWVLEGPPVGMLDQNGWSGKSLIPGDKIKMVIAPYRDGTKRGEFLTVKKASGEVLKF